MKIKGLLLAAMIGAATPVFAQNSSTLERRGHWTSFVSVTNDGKIVCGIDVIDESDGRHLMMKWFQGGSDIVFHVTRPNWSVRTNQNVPVVLRIDGNPAWDAPGVMFNSNVIEFRISLRNIEPFERQFRLGRQMVVSFPTGTERPWIVSLWGSNAIVSSWVECMRSAGPMPQRRAT